LGYYSYAARLRADHGKASSLAISSGIPAVPEMDIEQGSSLVAGAETLWLGIG